jgi:uncharacterized RDD family membrane protein YckC
MTTPAPAWPAPVEPAGPAPGVQFAGHGARLGAYVIDAIVVGTVTSALFLVVALPLLGGLIGTAINDPESLKDPSTWAGFGAGLGVFVLGALVISILALLYFPFFWARGGATPGMRVAGIRVVNDRDGTPLGWGAALLRLVGYWVSGAVFSLGFIWILVDSRRRGWHDLLAGTCVISTR